jgi:predicted ArsR family transcriptional regulator
MKDGTKTMDEVLGSIKKGNAKIADMAVHLGLSEGTVRKYVGDLLAGKKIEKKEGGGKVEGQKGRPADTYKAA